jgi:hypothetical protein
MRIPSLTCQNGVSKSSRAKKFLPRDARAIPAAIILGRGRIIEDEVGIVVPSKEA